MYNFITILIFFVILANQTLSLDLQYEACEPKNCGHGPNISHPFRLGSQESYCGYPNFEITCHDGYPILAVSNDDYIIKNIFYTSQSLLAASAAAYDVDGTCPTPLNNLSLGRTPFNISPGYTDLSFLYNCTSNLTDYPTYPISCASNATAFSFAGFHLEFIELLHSKLWCQRFVNAPVYTGGDVSKVMGENYSEILKLGFLLNWTAPNCSTCDQSGGRCGFQNNQFVCFCDDGPRPTSCDDDHDLNLGLKIGIGVAAVVFGMSMTCVIVFIISRRKKMKKHVSSSSLVSRSITSHPSSKSDVEKRGYQFGVYLFTYAELEEATNNFNSVNELGDGGFGTVYYGKLGDGRAVAVKRLYENNYKRVEQFMNEVDILTRLRHPNLVLLYGFTSRHSRELLLVYEYIPNGTVADHLHGEKAKPGALPWPTRINIAVETASALAYLHASDIIHRDVKTNNILLDNCFVVKVADFGLSRLFPTDVTHVSTAPQGTPGYVDPEYHQCYQLTNKSDVYSFGVVLIELISSLPAVDITRHRHEINLSNMAINKIQSQALHELVDRSLGYESDYATRRMINAVAELAFQCLQCEKDLRPSMDEVLNILIEIQSGDYNLEKAEEMDVLADDVGLLKSGPLPLSPVSVTAKWPSNSTTPNVSG